MYIEHPLIQPGCVEKRAYQVNISRSCSQGSTLVVMPTGLGKTTIALLVAAHRLSERGGKVLVLAPTKPLVEQHRRYFEKHLLCDGVGLFTGEVPPKKREKIWNENQVIISTPQVVHNDLLSRRIHLRDVALCVFDEAHRAVGNYAYVFIGRRYAVEGRNQLVLGITASPGSSSAKILEVTGNLGIDGVEIRTEYDPDVISYVQKVKVDWVRVTMPKTLGGITALLKSVFEDRVKVLKGFGVVPTRKMISTRDLLKAQGIIQARLRRGSSAPRSLYRAQSVQAEAIKINHALELAQTQGAAALLNYLERLDKEARSKGGSKASRSLMGDARVRRAMALSRGVDREHPKLDKVADIVSRQVKSHSESRIIVFTHYRDTSELVANRLSQVDGVKPVRFIGQASRGEDRGLSQKDQVDLIQRFRDGEFNTLVATSVAEEGLDIPQTDLVVFFEPIPSEIRTIQRRGRTGRKSSGRVVVLITTGTIDEGYYFSSMNKEKKMHRELAKLRKELERNLRVGDIPPPDREDGPADTPGADTDKKNPVDAGEMHEKEDTPTEKEVPTPAVSRRKRERDSLVEQAFQTVPGAPPQESDRTVKTAPSGRSDHWSGWEEESVVEGSGAVTAGDMKTKKEPERRVNAPTYPEEAHEGGEGVSQSSLFQFSGDDEITVLVDYREFNSQVVRLLSERGVAIRSENLPAGDYVLSDRVGIERKETLDFIMSLKDGRLFAQSRNLARSYDRPIMILEGDDVLNLSGMPQDAVVGAMASLSIDFNITIITTRDAHDTARFMASVAKREQSEGRVAALRGDKTAMSLNERQQYIVEGLPGISARLAKRLVEHFKTVHDVFMASEEELRQVRGIGKKTAREIFDAIHAEMSRDDG